MQLTGSFLDYFIAFWSGVLVSFTPCIYPVLPMTAGFITGFNTKGTRLDGFFISLIYVFGMALTYCAFAVAAAMTGKVFGSIQNHPVVFLVVACIMFFFALVFIDMIPLPTFGAGIQQHIDRKSVWSIFFFGMTAGLVVGPCTAPVLGTLLLYVASKQNVLHGVSLLFVFSYGVGASLILVGTFSGLLARLPKSGRWMVWIKQVCAAVMILAGVYFLIQAWRLFA